MQQLSRYLAPLAALGFVLGCSDDSGPAAAGGSSGTGVGGTGAAGSAGTSASGAGGGSSGASGAGSGGVGAGGSAGSTGGSAGKPPVDASCTLPNAAFCDAFTKPSPGGRAGDLDDANWSFSRLGFGCTTGFGFPATPINVCGVWQTVNPGGPDSKFCVTEKNDPRWSEGFDDNTSFNYIAARIRQPFDFKGRTGTIQWEADARTSGGHGWWVETWVS